MLGDFLDYAANSNIIADSPCASLETTKRGI